MMTVFNVKGTDIAFHYFKDFGKYLNSDDYVILYRRYYKICSKTYDAFDDKWILVVKKLPILLKGELRDMAKVKVQTNSTDDSASTTETKSDCNLCMHKGKCPFAPDAGETVPSDCTFYIGKMRDWDKEEQ